MALDNETTAAEVDEMMRDAITVVITAREREAIDRALAIGSAALCSDALHLYRMDCPEQGNDNMADVAYVNVFRARITNKEV